MEHQLFQHINIPHHQHDQLTPSIVIQDKNEILSTTQLSPYDFTNVDSGYNTENFSIINHYDQQQERHSLNRIDEHDYIYNYNKEKKTSISTPTHDKNKNVSVTPTTFNTRKMDLMHLKTPQQDQKYVINDRKPKSPLKRTASLSSISSNDLNNYSENIHLTPKKRQKNSINDEKKSIIKRNILTPLKNNYGLSPIKINTKFSKFKENYKINDNLINTSTPKYVSNTISALHKKLNTSNNELITRSNSPKRKNFNLKKFQSFSPVHCLNTTNNIKSERNFDVDYVKKRLNYQRNENMSILSRNDDKEKLQPNDKQNERKIISKETPTPTKIIKKNLGLLKRQSALEQLEIVDEELDNVYHLTKNIYENDSNINQLSCLLKIKEPETAQTKLLSDSNELTPERLRREQQNHSLNFNSFNNNSLNIDALLTKAILPEPDQQYKIEEEFKSRSNTPKKLFNKDNKCRNLNSDHEWNNILYTELPKTPPKLKLLPKRISFIDQSSQSSLNNFHCQLSSDVNRNLCNNNLTRRCYTGFKRLNIILHLEDEIPALDNIFSYLNGFDIINCAMVCHSWKRIIDNYPKALTKKQNYIRSIIPYKENNKYSKNFNNKNSNDFIRASLSQGLPRSLENDKTKDLKIPFSSQTENINNRKRSLCEPHSPPVSPSKRMFYENQKIVRKLDQNATLTKCPRCFRSSQIHSFDSASSTPLITKQLTPRRRLFHTLKKINSVPYRSLDSLRQTRLLASNESYSNNYSSVDNMLINSPIPTNCTIFPAQINNDQNHWSDIKNESFEEINKTLNDDSMPIKEYAICTRPSCKFKFCIKCKCEILPEHECFLVEILSTSPQQQQLLTDDITPKKRTIIGSKQSKRNLRRLC